MGRFGRGDDAPRVVGFDFGSSVAEPDPATAAFEPPPALPAQEYPPPPMPAQEYPPPPMPAPEYPPPAMPAPAYPPPAMAAMAGAPMGGAPMGAPPMTAPMPPVTPAMAAPQYGYPGYQQAGYGAPPPMQPPPSYQASSSGNKFRREVTVVVSLIVAIVLVGVGIRLFGGPGEPKVEAAPNRPTTKVSLPPLLEDLNAPQTLGGAPRLSSRASRALATQLRTSMLPNRGRHSEIEIYGDTLPEYAILAGEVVSGGSDRMYRWVMKKIPQARWGPRRAYAGGLVCGRYQIGTTNASMCAWGSKLSDGVVLGYRERDPARLAKVTVAGKRSLERGGA